MSETQTLTLGQRYDQIGERMSAAYAERRQHKMGTPEHAEAQAQVEAVYASLRELNKEAGAV